MDATVFEGKTSAANAVLGISPQKFCEKLLITAGAGAARCATIASGLLTLATISTVLGLPLTLLETIAVEVGKGDFKDLPSIEDFAKNLLSEISWTGINKATLVGARLNDALLMDFCWKNKEKRAARLRAAFLHTAAGLVNCYCCKKVIKSAVDGQGLEHWQKSRKFWREQKSEVKKYLSINLL